MSTRQRAVRADARREREARRTRAPSPACKGGTPAARRERTPEQRRREREAHKARQADMTRAPAAARCVVEQRRLELAQRAARIAAARAVNGARMRRAMGLAP